MYNLGNVIVQQRQLAHLHNRLERHKMRIGIVLREMGTIETEPPLFLVLPGAVGPEEDKSLASASRIGVKGGLMPKTPAPSRQSNSTSSSSSAISGGKVSSRIVSVHGVFV